MATKEYLIGANNYNQVVYAELRINKYNTPHTFSASFDTFQPFNVDEFDFEEHFEMWCDGVDKDYLYDLCCEFDCRPSELVSELAANADSVHDELDTNGEEVEVDGEEVEVDGEWWAFERTCMGQIDTSGEMKEFVNEEAYNMIMSLWKNHHCNEATDEIMEQLRKIDILLCDVDEYEWLADYIERVYA